MVGEVIVADNGSADGSVELSRAGGAVVHVPAKGYGSALMGGIAAARGKFVIMGDADGSYDFLDNPAIRRKSCARVTTWYRDAACPRVEARSARSDAASASLDRQSDCSR